MPNRAKRSSIQRPGWLVHIPKRTPPLEAMLTDIGKPSTQEIAKALGVHHSTVERWRRVGRAPKAAMLALFYATSWGRSNVNCQAENQAKFYFGYAAALRAELEAAQAQLARLGHIGEFGSANDPARGVLTAPATPPAAGPTDQGNRQASSADQPVSLRKTARFSQRK